MESNQFNDKRTRILGIDPGSRVTGFACIECSGINHHVLSNYRVIDAGIIKLSPKVDFSIRLGSLHEKLFELLEEFKPQIFVIEKAFAHVNISSALKLGEVRGALKAAAVRLNIPIFEQSPPTIKKMICGRGHGTKEFIAMALAGMLKIETTNLPLDATDALAIALGHSINHNLATSKESRTGP